MQNLQTSAQKELRRIVERIETIEEERKGLAGDVKDMLLEAKQKGFDQKIIRKLLALRKKSDADRQEEEALLATYMAALGMTPIEAYIEESKAA